MTTTNLLKFKDGRIWILRSEPADNEIAAKMGFTRGHFEDVTLEVAQVLHDALKNSDKPLANRDISELDD